MSTNGSAPAPDIVEQLHANMQSALAKTIAVEVQRHARSLADTTDEEWHALAKALAPFVRARVAEALAPLAKRIVELEAKVIDLTGELAKKVEYHRVWKAEVAYKPNNEVTFKGQLWFCEKPNSGAKPGTGNEWSLMHKRERL